MRVFISHSSEDSWIALRIADAMRRLRPRVGTFLDRLDIAHGDDFEERILEAEDTCDELMVLLTPWALRSAYVATEIAYFRKSRKRIVLVRLGISSEEIAASPVLPPFVSKLDSLHLNDLDAYLRQLAKRAAGAGDD
ncbi:MAG: toll/interleukin-1 receptor domain-containing protein [Geminicoccaceae bacterium]